MLWDTLGCLTEIVKQMSGISSWVLIRRKRIKQTCAIIQLDEKRGEKMEGKKKRNGRR